MRGFTHKGWAVGMGGRCVAWLFFWGLLGCVWGASFEPDPHAVQRFGKGYRYPQEGWIVVHIEGAPYERGVQHGRLLASEIAAYARCLAESFGTQKRVDSWTKLREVTAEIMLPHYPEELMEEMRGIAEGASAAGARIEGRKIDVTDVATINASNELDLLGDAVKATPGGLDGLHASVNMEALVRACDPAAEAAARPVRRTRPTRCSAFVANGSATKDGKIVFGHITMYDLYQANFYNVWLDVKPADGQRFAMQTTPGGIHSGMDFAINAAGLLLSETTIQQTAFDPKGIPMAVRIRQATQYADSIEKAAETLSKNGNGLSSTEWILGDIRRNEIALLTLGLRKHVLRRSSQKEWLEGAEGFYWSCNNAKDAVVRLETVPGMDSRPSVAGVFEPTKRDAVWLDLYRANQGRIDEGFARKALSTPALVSAFSADAVYTTADLAGRLQAWGAFGPPVGGIRYPSVSESARFPEIEPLVANPWALLEAQAPSKSSSTEKAADLVDPENPEQHEIPVLSAREADRQLEPAWRGTLLPESDGDVWLATGFANYERIVALEHALLAEAKREGGGGLEGEEYEELGVELNYYRSLYGMGVLRGGDSALEGIKRVHGSEGWHRVASGKGVLVLHHLRQMLGAARFDGWASEFGREHAGKRVSGGDFCAFLEKASGRDLGGFFKGWLQETGLPQVEVGKVESRRTNKSWNVRVLVKRKGACGAVAMVPVTVEFEEAESTRWLELSGTEAEVVISCEGKPERVILDKYGAGGLGNGHPFTILSFESELEDTWIVYGTQGDEVANLEAARLLQRALRRREHNIGVTVKADVEVKEGDWKGRHLVMVGRPSSHALLRKLEGKLSVNFASQSFEVSEEVYAHPATAVVFAERNPVDERYSMIVVAGVSARGTLRAAPYFEDETFPYAQTVVLPFQRGMVATTLPPPGSVREIK